MKRDYIIYWIATGLLCLMMLMSAGMYFFNTAEITKAFTAFGYPSYLVYPLGAAKVLGVIAILSKLSPFLKGLAYAGFFYDFVLAFFAHWFASDGGHLMVLLPLALLSLSYFYDRRLFTK